LEAGFNCLNIKENIMKNLKTILAGMVTGAALIYAGIKSGNNELILAGIAAIAQGLAAKDNNVTGGTVAQ
jgi:hypothetical protein